MSITIKDISTRELLDIRLNQYYPDGEVILVASRLGKGGEVHNVYATLDEIRRELSNRPHVCGKKEGKLIRRLKAQTGQSEEWIRAHPRYGQDIVDAQQTTPRRVVTKERFDVIATWYSKDVAEKHYKIH
jgi:hypothetical protein